MHDYVYIGQAVKIWPLHHHNDCLIQSDSEVITRHWYRSGQELAMLSILLWVGFKQPQLMSCNADMMVQLAADLFLAMHLHDHT